MNVSAKGTYALEDISDLALQRALAVKNFGDPLKIAGIAKRKKIPPEISGTHTRRTPEIEYALRNLFTTKHYALEPVDYKLSEVMGSYVGLN